VGAGAAAAAAAHGGGGSDGSAPAVATLAWDVAAPGAPPRTLTVSASRDALAAALAAVEAARRAASADGAA
jgi:hypothetical protein